MYELKKNLERYLRVICSDRALVLWKKNLPGRGLTKVEKHCPSLLLAMAKFTGNSEVEAVFEDITDEPTVQSNWIRFQVFAMC
jgi:hypothetical protein